MPKLETKVIELTKDDNVIKKIYRFMLVILIKLLFAFTQTLIDPIHEYQLLQLSQSGGTTVPIYDAIYIKICLKYQIKMQIKC